MDWLGQIRGLPSRAVGVHHEPLTPRYRRAGIKLRYILIKSTVLGARTDPERRDSAIEIACWAPPGHGRGPGYYTCFRLFFEGDLLTRATLYCFYDGSQDCPGFKALESAQAYAESNGFRSETNE